MKVIDTKETLQWRVDLDGKHYRVTRTIYSERGTYWAVHSDGLNWERYCDPDKPTHKRVVRAIQDMIA